MSAVEVCLTKSEIKTMKELMEYPDPIGVNLSEKRWRAFARHLYYENKALRGVFETSTVVPLPCCKKEKRTMEGGCSNCGDPSY